jgi:hypothetical protein
MVRCLQVYYSLYRYSGNYLSHRTHDQGSNLAQVRLDSSERSKLASSCAFWSRFWTGTSSAYGKIRYEDIPRLVFITSTWNFAEDYLALPQYLHNRRV